MLFCGVPVTHPSINVAKTCLIANSGVHQQQGGATRRRFNLAMYGSRDTAAGKARQDLPQRWIVGLQRKRCATTAARTAAANWPHLTRPPAAAALAAQGLAVEAGGRSTPALAKFAPAGIKYVTKRGCCALDRQVACGCLWRKKQQAAASLRGICHTYLAQMSNWAVTNQAQMPGFENPWWPGQHDAAAPYNRVASAIGVAYLF